ncbi:transcription factor UDT1-like [Typha angustifolia]|uniref:transcription factor UDT1-like n=1 Tax=Typha angustifolia TaxID=59011 RepID=UPI003C2CFC9A
MPRLCSRDRVVRQLPEAEGVDFVDLVLDMCDEGKEFVKPEVMEMCEEKYKSKNLAAERRRRSKLNNMILSLRALVPTITKALTLSMSKESTLVDAIDHIRMLEKQVLDLQTELSEVEEEEGEKQRGASTTDTMVPPETVQCQGEVELNPMGPNEYQLKIVYKNNVGQFTRVLEALRSFNVEVTNISYVTVCGFSKSVFCIEVKDDQEISVIGLRKVLLSSVKASEN